MIDIPEERLLKEITDLLMNELPKVLLEMEEQSKDGIRLPPFRYVGLEEKMPAGTGLPYAFVEIEEAEYTEKDRIVKNVIYSLKVTTKLSDISIIWRYITTLRKILTWANIDIFKISIESANNKGEIRIKVYSIESREINK